MKFILEAGRKTTSHNWYTRNQLFCFIVDPKLQLKMKVTK